MNRIYQLDTMTVNSSGCEVEGAPQPIPAPLLAAQLTPGYLFATTCIEGGDCRARAQTQSLERCKANQVARVVAKATIAENEQIFAELIAESFNWI